MTAGGTARGAGLGEPWSYLPAAAAAATLNIAAQHLLSHGDHVPSGCQHSGRRKVTREQQLQRLPWVTSGIQSPLEPQHIIPLPSCYRNVLALPVGASRWAERQLIKPALSRGATQAAASPIFCSPR